METKISIIEGDNFSGRTTYLKDKADFYLHDKTPEDYFQYLGSDTANFISGISNTVEEEIGLHYRGSDFNKDKWVMEGINNFSLSDKLQQNPFTLSGGEQTLLTILTLLIRRRPGVALDCALEQLSPANRAKVLDLCQKAEFVDTVLIADNRISEIRELARVKKIKLNHQTPNQQICSDEYIPYSCDNSELMIEHLNFMYKDGKQIFDDASLNIKSPEIFFLLGENGVGKSTLSKLLSGILKPNSGAFFLNQIPFTPHETPSEIFGYHFQNPDLQMFSNTAFEEIRLTAKNKDKSHVINILKVFGLGAYADQHPLDLPFSLRKRLAMAVTFAMEKQWVILDEPTIGQDDSSCKAIAEIIKKQSKVGTGFIIISHSSFFGSLFKSSSIRVQDRKIALVK